MELTRKILLDFQSSGLGMTKDNVPIEKQDNVSQLPRLAYTMQETAKILGVPVGDCDRRVWS